MPLLRITCPECGAGLKSATGFVPGRTVNCPKCETPFTVEDLEEEAAPPAKLKGSGERKPVRAVAEAADDDDERPKKKKSKKQRRDDDEDEEAGWSYKKSWIRYAVLGVLVVVMMVLGYLLYEKRKREKEANEAPPTTANADDVPVVNPTVRPGQFQGGPLPKGPQPIGQLAKLGPINKIGPPPPVPQNAAAGGFPFTSSAPVNQTEVRNTLTKKMTGVWVGTDPGGAKYEIEYRADGTFSQAITEGGSPRASKGTYVVAGLIGDKTLKLTRPNAIPPTVKVVLEGDELIHDTATSGQSVVLRKK